MGEHSVKWEEKIFLDLDYADDSSILDEYIHKMNDYLDVLRSQGTQISLKINVEKIS